MAVRARTPDPVLAGRRPIARRQGLARERGASATDIKREPEAPVVGVPWGLVAIAVAAAAWFVLAMVLLFGSGDPVSDYLLWIVGGFAVGFFGLTLGLARWAADDPRWARRGQGRLADLIDSNVAIFTGAIRGREAITQLLALPIALAVGATIIGGVFWAMR